MSLRTCILSIILFLSFAVSAQDKIHKKDGSILDAKVTAISGNVITYKRADNHDGPDYTVLKKDVAKVVYQNGTTDVFEGSNVKEVSGRAGKAGNSAEKTPKKYGDNILSIIPGAYTVDLDGTMNDAGIGICYERLLDRHGHIGFTLPVILSFLSEKDFYNYSYGYGGSYTGNYPSAKGYTSFSFMPGIKFYPARNSNSIRYSLGGSFFTMFGNEPSYVYDPNNGSPADYHYTMYGLMITNSVNISPSKHLYLAMDINGCMPLSDNRRSGRSDIDVLFAPMMQFLLKVGYRY